MNPDIDGKSVVSVQSVHGKGPMHAKLMRMSGDGAVNRKKSQSLQSAGGPWKLYLQARIYSSWNRCSVKKTRQLRPLAQPHASDSYFFCQVALRGPHTLFFSGERRFQSVHW